MIARRKKLRTRRHSLLGSQSDDRLQTSSINKLRSLTLTHVFNNFRFNELADFLAKKKMPKRKLFFSQKKSLFKKIPNYFTLVHFFFHIQNNYYDNIYLTGAGSWFCMHLSRAKAKTHHIAILDLVGGGYKFLIYFVQDCRCRRQRYLSFHCWTSARGIWSYFHWY